MKKLLSLILALTMLCSLALSAHADAVDCGDFTLEVGETDYCQVAEKANGQVIMLLYHNYDESDSFHSNINVVWMDTATDVTAIDPQAYAEASLSNVVSTLNEQGVKATNEQLLEASASTLGGENALVMAYILDADFTDIGVDLNTTLYYVSAVTGNSDIGSYIFTLTSSDPDEMGELAAQIDSIVWKE